MPAILVATAISAGVGAYSAHRQAKSAEKAAKTQVDASNAAAANTMDSTSRALDYIGAARNAPAPPSPFPAYNNLMSGQRRPGVPTPPSQPPAYNNMMGGQRGPGVPQSSTGLPSGYQALFGQAGQPGMVLLQSPDGKEQKSVPETEAQMWMQRGAKRVD